MTGFSIDVTFGTRALQARLDALQANIAERVVVNALNRAITTVRTEAVRQAREAVQLPARSLGKRMRVGKASRARPTATLAVRDYDPPLYLFKPRWRQRQPVGATVELRKGARQAVAGAFIAPTRYGRLAVFRREGRERSPLKFLRASDVGGPTVAEVLLENSVQRAMRRKGRETFEREALRLAGQRLALVGNGAAARLRVG